MQTLSNFSDVNEYLRGISRRLKHHGAHWRSVVQTISFELQARLAPGIPLLARTYNGQLANQITLTLRNGRVVKVTYHAKHQTITIRDATTRRTIYTFSPVDNIETVAGRCRQLAFRPRPKIKLRSAA